MRAKKPGNPLAPGVRTSTRKRGPKTRARARCDAAFSLYIRARDGHCRKCGGLDRLQCAHIVVRRYLSVRWDPANAVCLCLVCHARFTASPAAWVLWVDDEFGAGYYVAIHRKAQERFHGDYERVEAEIKALAG